MGLAKEAAMVPWLYGHKAVLWWLGALSVVTFVGTLVALPLVVARLPPDYFTHAPRPGHRHHAQSSGSRVLWRLGKKLMLLDFPGKRRLERRLVQQPSVWRALNWMRAKAHQPALELPTAATATPGERPEPS
jgi:hypothetical protein